MTTAEIKKTPGYKQVLMIRFNPNFKAFLERTRGKFLDNAGVTVGNAAEVPVPDIEVPAPAKEIVEDPIPFPRPSEITRHRQVMVDKRAGMVAATELSTDVATKTKQVALETVADTAAPAGGGLARRTPGSTNVAAEFSHSNIPAQTEAKVIDGNFPLQATATEPKPGRHMKPSPLDTSVPFDSAHESTPIGNATAKKYNVIEMRQQALEASRASMAGIVADNGMEAAALSTAYNQKDPNFLT